jgi:hypothetical protein
MQRHGVKVFLCGPQGVGKTYSLRTLLDPSLDLKVAAVFTEPSPQNVLRDILNHERFYWTYLPPYAPDWSTLIDVGKKLNLLTPADLQKMKGVDQASSTQLLDFLKLCNDFVDAKGRRVGDIGQLGPDWVFVVDSLTGLNRMARALVVGAKPVLSQPDWGVAMDNLQRIIDTLAVALKCHLIITAHIEYVLDEMAGNVAKFVIHTLGRKLGPVLGVNFDEIILARREGDKFFWSTADPKMDLRSSHLPLSNNLQPSFVTLIQAWRGANTK